LSNQGRTFQRTVFLELYLRSRLSVHEDYSLAKIPIFQVIVQRTIEISMQCYCATMKNDMLIIQSIIVIWLIQLG